MKITSYQLLDILHAAYLPVLSPAGVTEDTLYHAENVQQTPVEIFLLASFDTCNKCHTTIYDTFIKQYVFLYMFIKVK